MFFPHHHCCPSFMPTCYSLPHHFQGLVIIAVHHSSLCHCWGLDIIAVCHLCPSVIVGTLPSSLSIVCASLSLLKPCHYHCLSFVFPVHCWGGCLVIITVTLWHCWNLIIIATVIHTSLSFWGLVISTVCHLCLCHCWGYLDIITATLYPLWDLVIIANQNFALPHLFWLDSDWTLSCPSPVWVQSEFSPGWVWGFQVESEECPRTPVRLYSDSSVWAELNRLLGFRNIPSLFQPSSESISCLLWGLYTTQSDWTLLRHSTLWLCVTLSCNFILTLIWHSSVTSFLCDSPL